MAGRTLVRLYLLLSALKGLRRLGCLVVAVAIGWAVLGSTGVLTHAARSAVSHEVWRGLDRVESGGRR